MINFAQGDLMMFAAYGAAVMLGLGWLPLWAVIPLLFLGMIGLGLPSSGASSGRSSASP